MPPLHFVVEVLSKVPSSNSKNQTVSHKHTRDHIWLLQGRFDSDNFAQEVVDVAQKLVPLTVTLWNKVSAKMLPTPAKFHYLFNMRELSKVSYFRSYTALIHNV